MDKHEAYGTALDSARSSIHQLHLSLLVSRWLAVTGELSTETMDEIVDVTESLVLTMVIQLMSMGLNVAKCDEIFTILPAWRRNGF